MKKSNTTRHVPLSLSVMYSHLAFRFEKSMHLCNRGYLLMLDHVTCENN